MNARKCRLCIGDGGHCACGKYVSDCDNADHELTVCPDCHGVGLITPARERELKAKEAEQP